MGTAVDGAPYVEARGPHLPDSLTRFARATPILSWVFLAIAAADLYWNWTNQAGAPDPVTNALSVASWLPSIAICLFGAGLALRHRGAWSTHRVLLIGIVLLVLVEAMQVGSIVFSDQINTFARAADDLSPIGPGTLGVSLSIALIRVFGLVLVARGVLAVRQFEEDLNADRRMTIITLLSIPLVIASVASVVLYVSTLDLTSLSMVTIAYLILGALVSAMAVAALAYLATIVTAGWRARERPRSGWRFAALGVWLIFVALYIGTVDQVVALALQAGTQANVAQPAWIGDVFNGSTVIRAVGYLALLLGFVFGFPSPREDAFDDDEEEAEAYEAEPAT